MRSITVGTTQRQYPAIRNFLDSPVPGVEFVRTGNALRYPNHALFKLFGHVDPMLDNLHVGARGCDLIHFFNRVSLGSTPWVTTFETVLPRWDQHRPKAIRWGLKLLAGKPCRRLIAFSECTAGLQRALLAAHPDLADAILPKITVLHPLQRPLVDGPKLAPAAGEPVRFVIVGADFFRKGGGEVLRVFDRLLERGAPLRLDIVSTLAFGDYASHATAADQAEAIRLIARWPGAIVHHERLANEGVLDLLRQAHVGLLPSWADTYGYSVLEAQAAGCPVITTDIRALPEVNDDAQGWVIPVPKDPRGNGLTGTADERRALSAAIEAGVEQAVTAILADPASVAAKGAKAFARIATMHSPEAHGLRLRTIYEEALGG
ncbi:glycosyltransferase family 4 protein [Sphingomonas sp. G-3-2-10]|uniref:glycosyltransferase family 4 protein n=1 Tax=Sphingomonas sp. G-3-2-10 TaxID=2728838 RepID=UPI00146ECFC5|nr:glycosyltransferase family 4 protein [Sphingomonas sp. G-3-2-10]NML06236.1 glycosyltransferase family 4 protein [Sphingomonas sp. G-3-2-10]